MEILINQLSALFSILVFLVFIGYKLFKKQEIVLIDAILSAIAGGMLPIAMTFVIYPFFPKGLDIIERMTLQITLTGLVLLFVYSKTILERINS